jgi:hypothetical protein
MPGVAEENYHNIIQNRDQNMDLPNAKHMETTKPKYSVCP